MVPALRRLPASLERKTKVATPVTEPLSSAATQEVTEGLFLE